MSKSFLIPEHVYYSLLNKNKENVNIAESVEKMEKLLKNKKLDKSTKKHLYSQHLDAYLKHKNVIDNLPIKV